ncbi:PAS domain S-box protein [Salinigranum marinum]|uniref:PAS domain S-box protein n=1 Tax=Salinigranum marinum TaxID=1515595 RepID=UPI002989E761|nr:PAS domain S-box protein [Salinigranum marinum]
MTTEQDRSETSTVRVLCVDDDRDQLASLTEQLEGAGSFDVVTETTVEAGLSRVRAGEIDCVVSEFDLPEADGLAFLTAVRDHDPGVPFVLRTDAGDEAVAAAAISAGVTDYVRKDADGRGETLADRVADAVERSWGDAGSDGTAARRRETFGRITDSFLSIDDEWRITDVNERGAAFLGSSVGELLGTDLRELPPSGAARFHEKYAEAFRTQEPVSFEAESLTQPGRWIDIRAYPAADGLSIYWSDITTVRRREQLLADLCEGARDLLSIGDGDSVCARAVELVESMLGFEAACLHRRDEREAAGGEPSAPRGRTPAASTPGGGERLSAEATHAVFEATADHDEPLVVESSAEGATVASVPAGVVDPGLYLPVGDDRLLVAWDPGGGFEEFDVYCFQLLSTAVEIALTRTRRERALAANRNAIRALHGSAMEFQACERTEEVLDVAIRTARDVVSFDRCLFARHDEGTLERVAQSGELPTTDRRLPVTAGSSGRAYRTGESVVVDDARQDDDVNQPCPFPSLLTVPLGDWGVFQAVAEEPGAFDPEDRELAELLVMHVRAALARVRSDEALRRERDLLAAFFESSGEPVVRVRFEGGVPCVDRVNPAFERVFGVDADEIRDEPLDDHIVPPHDREAARSINEESRTGEPVEAEICRVAVDGPREFLFRSVPFRGDDGSRMAYGIYVDITARKRRERELERYRTIVESTGDPVYTLDDEGYITYVNEALESMTGYDAEALVGEHMRLLVPDEDVETSEALIRDLLGDPDRTNDTVELDIVRADGSRVRCENHIALLPFEEEFQGTAGAIRDITERKARKSELEAQNDRLDKFASVVSHDLRNPLQIAQGHLELAADRLDGEDESLDRVHDALERMDALVADVLALAREGESVSEPAFVSLADTVRLAWSSVDTAGARLVVETDATVLADAERLQRLLENLIRNSVEHGSTSPHSQTREDSVEHGSAGSRSEAEDREVTVRVGTLGSDGSDGAEGFFVADDGPGIPPDERERVFEAGYSTSDDGTGFGLDIVRSIASAHGWTVGVTTSDHGGARFEFRLPPDALSV